MSNVDIFPVPAIWKSKEYDFPITVIGVSELDGRYFCMVSESQTWIPFDEVVFPHEEEPADVV